MGIYLQNEYTILRFFSTLFVPDKQTLQGWEHTGQWYSISPAFLGPPDDARTKGVGQQNFLTFPSVHYHFPQQVKMIKNVINNVFKLKCASIVPK